MAIMDTESMVITTRDTRVITGIMGAMDITSIMENMVWLITFASVTNNLTATLGALSFSD